MSVNARSVEISQELRTQTKVGKRASNLGFMLRDAPQQTAEQTKVELHNVPIVSVLEW